MKHYIHFLKLYGLKNIIANYSTLEDSQFEINLDDDGDLNTKVISDPIKFIRHWYVRYILNYSYCLLIFCILAWELIYVFYKTISDISYLELNIFRILNIVQFILGIYYYQTQHFKNIMIKYKKYDLYIILGFLLGLTISILMIVIYLILIIFGINMNIYSELYDMSNIYGKIVLCILFALDIFYGFNIAFSNLLIISSILIINSIKLKKYSEKLNSYVENITEELTIDSIIREYTVLKNSHSEVIENLNNIFASITVLGIIHSYFVLIKYDYYLTGINNYIEIAYLVFIELIYVFSIIRVRKSINMILGIINTPQFFSLFLSKVKFKVYDEVKDDSNSKKTSMPLILDIKENDGKTLERESTIIDIEDFETNNDKINRIKDLSLRTMIKGHENGLSLDWIILSTKLSTDWDTFEVLGFPIDDATIIEQLVAIIIGLLMILNINNTYFA